MRAVTSVLFGRRRVLHALLALCAGGLSATSAAPAQAADPIKIGFSAQLTGGLATNGKQFLLAAQIWQEDINAKGGLLGRPIEFVYYDDQSNPAMVPGIYTKLLDIDKVDLVMASGTNISTPAMPTIIQHNKVVFATLALTVNDKFHYNRFFQTMPYGPDGGDAITRGFFTAGMGMNPKPKTIALVGADAEFSNSALEGARKNAKHHGLKVVYDRTYPPSTVDYGPIVRSIKAANADLVLVASYPTDTAGILRAASEIGLNAKMFGGPMVGLQYGTLKAQLGDQLNGIVCYELYVHEPTMQFPGIDDFVTKYRARAASAGTDPLGYYVPPLAYATFEVLAQSVTGVGGLDQDKLADYLHKQTFKTIFGDIKFGPDGEWANSRILTIQYQGVHGHDMEQFTKPGTQVILDPPEFKTGQLQYPLSEIKH
jgi:branched-chain amino acid transport system substrate-binding protein